MLSGSDDRTAKLWDLRTGLGWAASLVGHTHFVAQAVFAEARRVVTASGDKTLKLWDLRWPTTELATFRGHTDSVHCCAVRGELLVSGSNDRTARTWLLPP